VIKQGKKYHVIVMSGSFGCMPEWLSWGENERSAVAQAVSLHELSTYQARALRREGVLHLKPGAGADYIELSHCDCSSPEEHES
jgi:hypothetical protein